MCQVASPDGLIFLSDFFLSCEAPPCMLMAPVACYFRRGWNILQVEVCTGLARSPYRQIKDDFSNMSRQQMKGDISNGPGRQMRGDFPRVRAALAKKKKWKTINTARQPRPTKNRPQKQTANPPDKKLVINLI